MVFAVDAQFIMKMWTGGKTRHADVANDLALLNVAAQVNPRAKSLHVTV